MLCLLGSTLGGEIMGVFSLVPRIAKVLSTMDSD